MKARRQNFKGRLNFGEFFSFLDICNYYYLQLFVCSTKIVQFVYSTK